MRGKSALLLLVMLVACNGTGAPEPTGLESTALAVVNGNDGEVFPPPTGSQASPASGFDGANHLVVWSDARSGTGQDLYGARVSNTGELLAPGPIVISAAAGDEVGAAVAFDGTNYLVVWQDQRGTTGRDIYGARVSPDGTVLDPGGIPITRAAEHQVEPAVAFDGSSYLVVWEDRSGGVADVRGARVGTDGKVLAAELLISGAPLHQTQPSVACATGTCLVAWRDGRTGGPDVYGARVVGNSVVDPSGLPISRAGSSQGRPAVGSDGSGYLVVWNDTRSGTGDVYGTRVAADGQILDAAGLAIATAADAQQSPEVGFEGAYYVVAWHDRRSGVAFDVYGARVTPAGEALDPSGFLVDTGGAGTGTSVSSDRAGHVLVTFGALQAVDELTTVTRVRTQAVTVRAELAVSLTGNGSGSVASEPAGIACGDGCAAMFDAPTVVTLTPTAAAGSVFVGWSGACAEAGVGPCTLTVDQARLAIAKFSPLYALTVVPTGTGTGEVTSDPAGIACGASCAAELVEGTVVTLSAVPSESSVFAGWSGACSGKGTCVVAMDAAQEVTATFVAAYRLTVSIAGGSPGTVSGGATGPVAVGEIACGDASGACSAVVASGDSVTLRAAAGGDAVFKGWSGACTGLGDCTFAMTAAKNVTATFQPATYTVTVGSTGGGAGTVTGGEISCTTGSTTGCTAVVANTTPSTVLTLTATPDASSIVKSWYGCTSWSGNTCSVTVSSARSITAVIQPSTYPLSVNSSGLYGAAGTVTGPGIACTTGSTTGCSAPEGNGGNVTLTATPDASSVFKKWMGCTSSTGATCTVAMTSAKNVTATFEPSTYALSVTSSGLYGAGGTISGPGLACSTGSSSGCSAAIANGETVTLTATPDASSVLKKWVGCTSPTGTTCTVAMTSAKSVTASFEPAEYALNVNSTGLYGATGTVTGPGIGCSPGDTTGCSTTVANGATVTLVAEPAAGSLFKSWSGCTSTSGATCTISMTSAKTATATFHPAEYTLTVNPYGLYGATGTITGPGISCTPGAETGCSAPIANGATVSLVAEPAPGSILKSWSGCTSVSGTTCNVTMTTAKTATAQFQPSEFTLTVNPYGTYGATGTVTGPGISCTPGDATGCSTSVANGATVTLVAEPAPGSIFKSWSGCTSASGATCTVTMTAAKTATAQFQPSEFTLNVNSTGLYGASGTVSGPGIACAPGATTGCSTSVANGSTVSLVAQPDPGSMFKSWSGCTSVSGTTCNVTMTSAKTATAQFQPSTFTLTVTPLGAGRGTVSGPGIACTSGSSEGCTAAIDTGATVTLTAAPSTACDTFTGWSGSCSGTGACSVTMTMARSVYATFGTITGCTP